MSMIHTGVTLALLSASVSTGPAVMVNEQAKAYARMTTLSEMQAAGIADPGTDFWTLNAAGYKAICVDGDITRGLKFFRWNLTLFAEGTATLRADLTDSLADGFVVYGDTRKAIATYEAALAIAPKIQSDPDAPAKLARLRADPKSATALSREICDAIRAAAPWEKTR